MIEEIKSVKGKKDNLIIGKKKCERMVKMREKLKLINIVGKEKGNSEVDEREGGIKNGIKKKDNMENKEIVKISIKKDEDDRIKIKGMVIEEKRKIGFGNEGIN